MENNQIFTYSYSAKEQEEINWIREKYIPAEESTMEKLRKLDKSAEKPGTITAILTGTIGTLIFGSGMSIVMLTSHHGLGIAAGLIGMAGIGCAYPIYKQITVKKRREIAPKILELADKIQK